MAYPRWWTDTVTVHHKAIENNRAVWTAQTYTGAYFRMRTNAAKANEFQRKQEQGICRFRVPAPDIALGDIITLGTNSTVINDYIAGQRSTDYIAGHECFVVTEIHDNTHDGTGNPHVYVAG